MSTSIAHNRAPKKRNYRLGKRATQQEETRRRIVEAAVDLHTHLGPARTTVAQIAERAGVQRHTYYAHFPDDRSLFLACSALSLGRDPLPDVEAWSSLPAGRERLGHGLEQLYAWYRRNETVTASILRDAEVHEITREIVGERMVPTFARAHHVLGEGLGSEAAALLGVALQFGSWRTLSSSHEDPGAAALMASAIAGLDRQSSSSS
jgi:AcrR family transcriptional regulator